MFVTNVIAINHFHICFNVYCLISESRFAAIRISFGLTSWSLSLSFLYCEHRSESHLNMCECECVCVGEWMWELLCQVIPHTEIYIPSYLKYLERRLNWRKENNSFGTCESATSRQNQTRMFIHTRTFVERKIYSSATSKPSRNEWKRTKIETNGSPSQTNERESESTYTPREKKFKVK